MSFLSFGANTSTNEPTSAVQEGGSFFSKLARGIQRTIQGGGSGPGPNEDDVSSMVDAMMAEAEAAKNAAPVAQATAEVPVYEETVVSPVEDSVATPEVAEVSGSPMRLGDLTDDSFSDFPPPSGEMAFPEPPAVDPVAETEESSIPQTFQDDNQDAQPEQATAISTPAGSAGGSIQGAFLSAQPAVSEAGPSTTPDAPSAKNTESRDPWDLGEFMEENNLDFVSTAETATTADTAEALTAELASVEQSVCEEDYDLLPPDDVTLQVTEPQATVAPPAEATTPVLEPEATVAEGEGDFEAVDANALLAELKASSGSAGNADALADLENTTVEATVAPEVSEITEVPEMTAETKATELNGLAEPMGDGFGDSLGDGVGTDIPDFSEQVSLEQPTINLGTDPEAYEIDDTWEAPIAEEPVVEAPEVMTPVEETTDDVQETEVVTTEPEQPSAEPVADEPVQDEAATPEVPEPVQSEAQLDDRSFDDEAAPVESDELDLPKKSADEDIQDGLDALFPETEGKRKDKAKDSIVAEKAEEVAVVPVVKKKAPPAANQSLENFEAQVILNESHFVKNSIDDLVNRYFASGGVDELGRADL